ncbi:hypothetical protein F4775DRAFT_568650 [Biscogniauxia sp. FL1348]|nr:hypothetical protein F4775DRAFT_568650 [Biscogniauxia sp. FL1348]
MYTTYPHVPRAHPHLPPKPRSIPTLLAPLSLTILSAFLLALNALYLTAYGLRTSDVVLRSRASWATPELEVAVLCALVVLLGVSSPCPSLRGVDDDDDDDDDDDGEKGDSSRGAPGDEQGARREGQGGWDASALEPSFLEPHLQPFPAYDLHAQNCRLRRQSSAYLFPPADDVTCPGDDDSTCWIERASSGATRVASRSTTQTRVRARGISPSPVYLPMPVSTSHDSQLGVLTQTQTPSLGQAHHQAQAGGRNTGNASFGDNDNNDHDHGDDDLRRHIYNGEVVFFRASVHDGNGDLLSPTSPSTATHNTPSPSSQSAHRVPSWQDIDSDTATDIGNSDADDHRPPTPMVPDAVARVVSLSPSNSGIGDSEAGDGRTWWSGTDATGDERKGDRERRGRSYTADAGAILVATRVPPSSRFRQGGGAAARLVTIPPRASARLCTF